MPYLALAQNNDQQRLSKNIDILSFAFAYNDYPNRSANALSLNG